MSLLRNLLARRLLTHTLHPLKTPPFPHTRTHPHRPIITTSPQNHQNQKKPLHALFMEAVGLNETTRTTTPEEEQQQEEESGKSELQKNLRQLEEDVKSLKEKAKKDEGKKDVMRSKRRSLFAVFTNLPDDDDDDDESVVGNVNKGVKLREPMVLKELSPDMEVFVEHLFRNGYFRDANFARGKERFDLSWFESYFARGYIKFAAQRFGRDNQEIAKWLSGSALKQVAMFGCPSVDRGSVFPAKRLRKFFEVPENTVCSKCTLRQSCKFANQSVWKGDTKTLDLVVVMKVLTSYALELVHSQLVVPDEVNKSVSQLLKEVVKLSQTT